MPTDRVISYIFRPRVTDKRSLSSPFAISSSPSTSVSVLSLVTANPRSLRLEAGPIPLPSVPALVTLFALLCRLLGPRTLPV